MFCIFQRLFSSTRSVASTPPLVACERRPARNLIPIRERALYDAVGVLVQKVARLREPRRGIRHKPLILRAVAVAFFDRQARITRFLACGLCPGNGMYEPVSGSNSPG